MKDKKAPTSDSPGSARQIDTGVTPQHNPSRLTPDRGGGLSEGYIPTEPRDTYMGPPPPVNYRPLVFMIRNAKKVRLFPALVVTLADFPEICSDFLEKRCNYSTFLDFNLILA